MAAHWNGDAGSRILAQLSFTLLPQPPGSCRLLLTMLRLTSATMAELAIQRLIPAQLILDLFTMTARLVLDIEVLAVFVDAVGWGFLPFVLALGGGGLLVGGGVGVFVLDGLVGGVHGGGGVLGHAWCCCWGGGG
jgi:hypothetical protein